MELEFAEFLELTYPNVYQTIKRLAAEATLEVYHLPVKYIPEPARDELVQFCEASGLSITRDNQWFMISHVEYQKWMEKWDDDDSA